MAFGKDSSVLDMAHGILPALIAASFCAMLGYGALHVFDWGATNQDFKYVLPAFLALIFAAYLALFAVNARRVAALFSGIDKNTWVALVLILVVAALFRVGVVPQTHRIFFDEDLYIGIANVIASEGKSELCNYGTPTECREGILNKEPNAYPFFVAVLYALLWPSNPLVFHLFTFFGVASVALLFFVVYLLTDNERTALYAAFLLALLPSHIVWSASISVELFFVFFALASLIFFLAYVRLDRFPVLLLATVSLAFTVQSRPESAIFGIVCFLAVLLYKENRLSTLASMRFWLPWMVFALLVTPHVAHLKHAEETDDWGAGGRDNKFSWQVAERQWPEMSRYWLNGAMYPQAFTVFAACGVVYAGLFARRLLLLCGVWFALFFVLFTFFYAGGVLSGGIGTRFANIYSVPVLVVAAYGLGRLGSAIEKTAGDRHLFPFIVVLVSFLSLQSTMEYVTVPDQQAQYARDMHDFVYEHMDDVPEGCFVLTHTPSIFLINGKGGLQTWYGSNAPVMDRVFAESGGCVYYLEGAWCLFPPHKDGVCAAMHKNYELEEAYRLVREENPGQVFTLYRVRRTRG